MERYEHGAALRKCLGALYTTIKYVPSLRIFLNNKDYMHGSMATKRMK